MSIYSDYTIQRLSETSSQLIDLAATLELCASNPAFGTDRLKRIVAEDCVSIGRTRQDLLGKLGREVQAIQERNAKTARYRAILEAIVPQLPAAWNAQVCNDTFGDIWIKSDTRGIGLKNVSKIGGEQLALIVTPLHGQTRRFPLKADGTFSIKKLIDVIEEDVQTTKLTRQRLDDEAAREKRFKELLTPYCQYGPYGSRTEIQVDDRTKLIVAALQSGKFQVTVQTTTTTFLEDEELQTYLKENVKQFDREKGERL